MLDCGWDERLETDMLSPIKEYIPLLNAVLISHADFLHLGALPYVYSRWECNVPIFINKDGTIMTTEEHKKSLRDRDGGISEHIEKDSEENRQASAQAKSERARRRKEAVTQAKKREFNQNLDKRIAMDDEQGEAAAAHREYLKENEAYQKRKEAFEQLVEKRKAQKARA